MASFARVGAEDQQYDLYSQTIATTPSEALVLTFDYNTTGYPDGLIEETDASSSAATPEPASLAMLGIGIAGMAGYTWRRRKPAAA